MSSTAIAAWIGVAGFVVSLVNVLWILSKEMRTRKSIRAMVCTEIEDNLSRLRDFRVAVNQVSRFSNGHPMSVVQKNDELRLKALPTFHHSVWRSLTASIPTALTPAEIRGVHRFQVQLDELAVVKERLDLPPSQRADAIEEAITRLIENGNPLKVPAKAGAQP
jgi:hypothetical protein